MENTTKKADAIEATRTATTAIEAVALAREELDKVRHQLDKTDEAIREAVRVLAGHLGILPGQ